MLSYRKIGGIHYLTVGRFGFCFYRRNRHFERTQRSLVKLGSLAAGGSKQLVASSLRRIPIREDRPARLFDL
jgi:hypothetical protein